MRSNFKYKTVSYLHKRLLEAGVTSFSQLANFRYKWLDKMEKEGSIVSPKGGKNKKCRLYTEEQIDAIIKAFTPGGECRWSYLENQ